MSCWRGMAQAYPRHVYHLDGAEVGLCLIVVVELVECFKEAIRKFDPVVDSGEEHLGLLNG